LIDGNRSPPDLPCGADAIVKGDGRCLSIAAASIVAKVIRDRIMDKLDARHPAFGWSRNSGYPTAGHRAAIAEHGVTAHHRRSFRMIHR
ncbi:MAG: ribonuclease HII, partial [Pseudomonadota bacterium]